MSSSQLFLREFDKKLWTAADRLRSDLAAAVYFKERGRLAHSCKITSTRKGHRRLACFFKESQPRWPCPPLRPPRLRSDDTPVVSQNEKSVKSVAPPYVDISSFCKSATLQEITSHGHVLTLGRFVGAEDREDDGESFDEKMTRLDSDLNSQFTESAKLEAAIKENLKGLSYAL